MQEFMVRRAVVSQPSRCFTARAPLRQIAPIGAPSFSEALRYGAEVFHVLKGIIKAKYGQDSTNVGDEGGFAPGIKDAEEGLQVCGGWVGGREGGALPRSSPEAVAAEGN